MNSLLGHLKVVSFRKKWRKSNLHNKTIAYNMFDPASVKVGKGTYGSVMLFNDLRERVLVIGNYCSIAENIVFIMGHDHNLSCVSTYPFNAVAIGECNSEATSKGDIIVSDDVWIGYGATILSGVHIGQGAVVAAGAVVTKDVPPYAVVGGVPAKVIKYRFEQPVIDYMLTLDYGSLTEDLIREHVDDLYTEIDGMELEEVKKLFAWFPKKERSLTSKSVYNDAKGD